MKTYEQLSEEAVNLLKECREIMREQGNQIEIRNKLLTEADAYITAKSKRISDLESALNEIKAIAAQDFNSSQLPQANHALEAIHDIADAVVSPPPEPSQ